MLVNPGVTELCGNGVDDDCVGGDEVCAPLCTDIDGDNWYLEVSGCDGVGGFLGHNDCDDLNQYINPGGIETCDGFDNDCSDTDHTTIDPNEVDNGCDDDSDGYCDNGMPMYNNNSMCINTPFVVGGQMGDDCDDTNLAIYLSNPEICDGLDNNCSDPDHAVVDPLQIDEGLLTSTCQYTCDTVNTFVWTGNGGDLNCCGDDINEAGPYEATEVSCSDGYDNDCNGLTDSVGGDPNCIVNCAFNFTFPCELL
jgi:hypothetical protein